MRSPIAALLGLVLAPLVAMTAVPAEAAAPKHPRVGIVAASADRIVYRQRTTTAGGFLLTRGSTLRTAGADGRSHALAGFDPEGRLDLSGVLVVQPAGLDGRPDYDPGGPHLVHWRDLRSGAEGRVTLEPGDAFAGAAPGGWLATRTVAGTPVVHRLVRYARSGSVTDLGVPLPGGGAFDVQAGPDAVVAVPALDFGEESPALVRARTLAATGAWRTLHRSRGTLQWEDVIHCARPSRTHVACAIESQTARAHTGPGLLALDGGRAIWLDRRPGACTAVAATTVGRALVGAESSDAGPCTKGRLVRLDDRGRLTRSRSTWRSIDGGLGTLLAVPVGQRTIERLRTVHSRPRTLLAAR